MTIVVAAAAPDGIVLASDGRTTMLQGSRHRVASDHTRKVFAPFDGTAIATYGAAFIGDRTIAGAVEEFIGRRSDAAGTLIADVSRDLATFFEDQLTAHAQETGKDMPPGVLGFVVAGYDPDGVGKVHEVLLPRSSARDAVVQPDVGTRAPGVLFRGRTRYIRRMVEGYDKDALRASGVKLPAVAEHELRRLGYVLRAPVSLQDAVDMAVFVVRMTVDMERLTDGTYADPGDVPACGGQIQVLMVSRTGSRWVAEPQLSVRNAGMAEAGN